jgi:hypothetical protein
MAAPAQVVVGAFLLAVGVVGVKYSYRLSRLDEQLDAVGSTTSLSDVEPAAWKVLGTKAVAALVGVFGGVTLASGLLA